MDHNSDNIDDDSDYTDDQIDQKLQRLHEVAHVWQNLTCELALREQHLDLASYTQCSIVPSERSSSLLVSSSTPTPCPLCDVDVVAPNTSLKIKLHMSMFHDKHSFICKGHRFLLCRLRCMKSGRSHYHCKCGRQTRIRAIAEAHSRQCSTILESHPGHPCSSQSTSRETPIPGSETQTNEEAKMSEEVHMEQEAPAKISEDAHMKREAPAKMSEEAHMEQEIPSLPGKHAKALSEKDALQSALTTKVISKSPRLKTLSCPFCFKMTSKKNIRRHIRTHSTNREVAGVCVCKLDGVFLVENSGKPVHVVAKMFSGEMKFRCELKDCQMMFGPASRGMQNYMCRHVMSSLNLTNTVAPVKLHSVEDVSMSEGMKIKVEELIEKAKEVGKTVIVRWPDTSIATHVSVYCEKVRHWCPLGRVLVSVKQGEMKCPCSGKYTCVHKALVRVALHSDKGVMDCVEDEDDTGDELVTHKEHYMTVGQTVESDQTSSDWLAYLCQQDLEVGQDLRDHIISSSVVKLRPKETICPWCKCEVLALRLATSNATVVDHSFVQKGVYVLYKECTECQRCVYYRGSEDGLLAYNNTLIITLELCRWLQCSVQNHSAVSTELLKLEAFHLMKFPAHDAMMKVFLRYVALSKYGYSFTCLECGIFPPVIITDVNKKCCFRLKVCDVGGATTANESVDMKRFWGTVHEEIVACKKVSDMLSPSYDNWAPFIGEACSVDEVCNTEYMKVSPAGPPGVEDDDNILNEDFLIELMTEKKLVEVKKVCRSLNLSDKGMKIECLERLRQKLSSRDTYNKVFTKFAGSSGGLLCACCPHGVVYGIKFLLRGESPRDHVDMLLSFDHQPTLTVCDIPSFVARHGNKRKRNMFYPNKGRFAEENIDTISKQKEGILNVSIPELDMSRLIFTPSNTDHLYAEPDHPLTHTSNHYCAYDRFHEGNTTVDAEHLRRLDIVPECSLINSQVVEEFFSWIDKSRYFLSQMSPIHHIVIVRLLCHLSNERINGVIEKNIMQRIKTTLPDCEASHGPDKRLTVSGQTHSTTKQPLSIIKKPKTQTSPVPDPVATCKQSERLDGPPVKKSKKNVTFTINVDERPAIFDIVSSIHQDAVVARIGPHALFATDFLSLTGNQWLTDKVIDAYIYLIVAGMDSVLTLPTQTMTFILNGSKGPMTLRKVRLQNYAKIVGVFHQGGAHWTAVVIYSSGLIHYYDPFGEKQVMKDKVMKSWSFFMDKRIAEGIENYMDIEYKVPEQKRVQRQIDQHNCGVLTLKFIHDKLLTEVFQMPTLKYGRGMIAQRLHEASELPDVYCRRCGRGENMVDCSKCRTTFHLTCTPDNKRNDMICFFC